MSTLLLRLAGPLQAWGTKSKFAYRFTDTQPSKSAILGLLAAADGRRRTEPIEDLLALSFGVRLDHPGTVVRDFQTARSLDGRKSFPLTYRYYLSDAVFLAGVEGEDELIDRLASAIRQPAFPLYLGRRSCPPSRPIFMKVTSFPIAEALRVEPWQASQWLASQHGEMVGLEAVLDVADGETPDEVVNDLPLSFDPHHRQFLTRGVVRHYFDVVNPSPGQSGGVPRGPSRPKAWSSRRGRPASTEHDPMGWWPS